MDTYGYVKNAVRKRTVDFAGLGSGLTQRLILGDRIEVLHWREITLLVRVHSHSLASGAGTIRVGTLGQSVSLDDANAEFIDPSSFNFVLLDSSTPSTAFISAPQTNIYPMFRLVAEGSRTGAGALNATVSVEFSCKDA